MWLLSQRTLSVILLYLNMNIRFNYLYRDGGNYKQFGYVVFSNTLQKPLPVIDEIITSNLIDGLWFYADKWHLKDLHKFLWDNNLDHNWHEYESIEECEENVTNGDIAAFLQGISDG